MDLLLDPPSEIKAIDFTEDENGWLCTTMQHFVAMLNEDMRESMGITPAHLETLNIEQSSQNRSTKTEVLPIHALPSAATLPSADVSSLLQARDVSCKMTKIIAQKSALAPARASKSAASSGAATVKTRRSWVQLPL
jgi:hypothetical protein